MERNEGREATDAGLLRDQAATRDKMTQIDNDPDCDGEKFGIALTAWQAAEEASADRGREYLSGTRPMPERTSEVAELRAEVARLNRRITLADAAVYCDCAGCGGRVPLPNIDSAGGHLVGTIDGYCDGPVELNRAQEAYRASAVTEAAPMPADTEGTSEIIVGHSVTPGGWCVYEQTAPGEYNKLKGPFPTRDEAETAMRNPTKAQRGPEVEGL